MDPFSITTGCIGLVASIQSLITVFGPFVVRIRSARKDIEAVHREVSALHICIVSLEAEPPDSKYPASLQRTLHDVIKQCNIIVDEMSACLSNQDRTKWALTGQSKINVLRSRLEAHKSTIDIALEMMALPILARVDDTATAIHAQATEIKQDTEEIHQQTTQLLAEIKALKTQIAEMEAAQPAQSQNQNNGHAYILQRFLDQSSTYAESMADHRHSISNLEVVSEAPLSDGGCVPDADDDEPVEKAAGAEEHENASDGEVDKGYKAADNETNVEEEGDEVVKDHTEANEGEQDEPPRNKASDGAGTYNHESNTSDSGDKKLKEETDVVREEIEREEEAENHGKAEEKDDAEVREDQDVETASIEAGEQGDDVWKGCWSEKADDKNDVNTDATCVEDSHETARSVILSRADITESTEDQHQEPPTRQTSVSRNKQKEGYEQLTLSWTPAVGEEQDDLSRSLGDLLHKLRNEIFKRDTPQTHSQQCESEPTASPTLAPSESVKVPETRPSSTVEELQQEQGNDLEVESVEQNIERLQLQINSLMYYETTGMEEVLRALELELWQAKSEQQRSPTIDKEPQGKQQDVKPEVDNEDEQEQDHGRYERDDPIQPVQLKATLDGPEWDVFHIYNTPTTMDEVQTRYRFQNRRACSERSGLAKPYAATDLGHAHTNNWSLDTEKEVVSAYHNKRLPVIPTNRFTNAQKRFTIDKWLNTEGDFEKELVIDAEKSPSFDSAVFDTEKELAIYFEKELAPDAGEVSKLEQLENHKIQLDEAIGRITSTLASLEANKACEKTGRLYVNEPLDRLRKLRDMAATMITTLRNETHPARDRPCSRQVNRNAQDVGNGAADLSNQTVGKHGKKPTLRGRSKTTQDASSNLQSRVMPRLFPRNHRRTASEADSSHNNQPKPVAREAQATGGGMSELIDFIRESKPSARAAQMTRGAVPDLLEFLRDTQPARPEARGAKVVGASVSHLADCIRHTGPRAAAVKLQTR